MTGEATLQVEHGGGNFYSLDAQVFRKMNEVYAIYFAVAAETGTLDLSEASGSFHVRWFNPRSGEFEGETHTIKAGSHLTCGPPPSDAREDWVLLLKRELR